jgi:hypothetical protein
VSCTGFEADSDTCTNFDPHLGNTLHCQLSIPVKTWLGIPSVEPMGDILNRISLSKKGGKNDVFGHDFPFSYGIFRYWVRCYILCHGLSKHGSSPWTRLHQASPKFRTHP